MGDTASRDTRQKRAIRAVFGLAERPLSTDEVLEAARRESSGLGIATVYRSIRALVDDGWLAAVDLPGCGTRFERSGKGHHHHFVCEACERAFELDGCAVADVHVPAGFRVARHDVTVYGTCDGCAALASPT